MDVAKALKAGMEVEERGEAFYSRAAEKVENPHGRLTLRFLAMEEKKHLGFLEGLLGSLGKGASLEKRGLPGHPVLKKEEMLENMRRMGVKGKVPEENKEIIARAMDLERNSIEFYEGFLSKAGGGEWIFKTLAEEERKHLEWLEFILDALEIHGYWYDLDGYFALGG